MEKRILKLKEQYKNWVVIATHLHKLNANETPWIVFEGSEKECLNYVFERNKQDVDEFGNYIDLEVWPEWEYKFYYTDELKEPIKKVIFNATCVGSYVAELEIPSELTRDKTTILSYICDNISDWKIISEIEFLDDRNPYDTIIEEDILEVLTLQ